MNKVVLMGRLTSDPQTRYTAGKTATTVCHYTVAVNRSYSRDGEPDADFINIVAFGNRGEFANKYFKKGMMVAIVGELRTGSYTDKDGNKRYTTDVIATEQHFCESKAAVEARSGRTLAGASKSKPNIDDGFRPIPMDDAVKQDLPF